MGILENVLAKMQTTPQFRPVSVDTFSDWSIEAGDIITVDVDGSEETLPVFSSDMEWGGAARSTLSCTGNRERPTLSKAERQSYAAFGGVSRQIQKTNEKILEDRKELIAALNGEDGAPEDLSSGISNYVRYDLENNEAFAGSTLFAQIGEKAKAEIRVYTVMGSDGKAHSLAGIVADVIQLKGDTEILGNLSISEGRLRVEKSIITPSTVFANKFSSNDAEMLIGGHRLNIGGDFSADGEGIAFGTQKYTPTKITSTTGTVLALGIA